MTLIDKNEILTILSDSLTNESKYFLWTLIQEKRELNKEELRDLANEVFVNKSKIQDGTEEKLVTSRHGLDIHSARLEGAGLVAVRKVGQMRFYSVTPLGHELFDFIVKKSKQQIREN